MSVTIVSPLFLKIPMMFSNPVYVVSEVLVGAEEVNACGDTVHHCPRPHACFHSVLTTLEGGAKVETLSCLQLVIILCFCTLSVILIIEGVLDCIRVLGGYSSNQAAFNADDFNHKDFGSIDVPFNVSSLTFSW